MRLALILGILAFPVCAQSGLPPEVLLLSRIRHHTAADLSHLPNFTCLETIERSTRSSPLKPFDVRDVVQVEVAHVGKNELFAWPGASNFETRPLGDMVGSGMTSSGEYSAHASAVFEGDAVIHYVGEEEIGGHRAARYDYEISPAFSGYAVHVNGRSGVVGVRGAFWADTTTFDLQRLTVEGTEIPEQLGVRAMLTDINYGRLRIASGDFLLPQSANIWMGLESGIENRNRIDFTHCRQYTTESVLSFGETPSASLPAPARTFIEFTLPPSLMISLRLEAPIQISTAKVGDAISASLNSDLKQNGQLIAPKGSIVSGRVRLFQNDGKRHIAGLEFTDLAFENNHARFIAVLVSADSRYTRPSVTSTRFANRPHIAGRVETRPEIDLPPELPGVATFFIPAGVGRLPKGMLMEWRTVRFRK